MSITLHTEKSTTLSTLDFFEHGAAVEVEEEDGEEEDGEVKEGEEEEEEEEEEEGFEGEEYKVEEEEDTAEEDLKGDEEDALLGAEGGSES